jgi:hypothetical protein
VTPSSTNWRNTSSVWACVGNAHLTAGFSYKMPFVRWNFFLRVPGRFSESGDKTSTALVFRIFFTSSSAIHHLPLFPSRPLLFVVHAVFKKRFCVCLTTITLMPMQVRAIPPRVLRRNVDRSGTARTRPSSASGTLRRYISTQH